MLPKHTLPSDPPAEELLVNDEPLFRWAIESYPELLRLATKENAGAAILADTDFVWRTLLHFDGSFASAPEELRRNISFVLHHASVFDDSTALENYLEILRSDTALRSDAEAALGLVRFVKYYPTDLNDVPLQLIDPLLWKDRSFVLAAVSIYGTALQFASEELRADRELVLAALRAKDDAPFHRDWRAIQFASEELRNDTDIAKAALDGDTEALAFIPDSVPGYRELVMQAVMKRGWALEDASEELRADPEIVRAAVDESLYALRYVSPALPDYRAFILWIVQMDSDAFQLLPEELRADPEIAAAALEFFPINIKYASPKLPGYRDSLLALLKQSPWSRRSLRDLISGYPGLLRATRNTLILRRMRTRQCLRDAAHDPLHTFSRRGTTRRALKQAIDGMKRHPCWSAHAHPAERRLIREAICEDGMLLQGAPDELRADRDLVMQAVSSAPCALRYASDALRDDRDIVFAAVSGDGDALEWASERLRGDRAIVMAAVSGAALSVLDDGEFGPSPVGVILDLDSEGKGTALRHASEALRADRELVLAAVRSDGLALHYAAEDLRNDHELVLAAIENNPEALEFASPALRASRSIVLAALERSDAGILRFAGEALSDDRGLFDVACRQSGHALMYASPALTGDRDFMLPLIAAQGELLHYASPALRDDRDAVEAAVESDAGALRYASLRLRGDAALAAEAVQRNASLLPLLPAELRADRDIVMHAVRACGGMLEHADASLRADRDIVLAAVADDGWSLCYAAEGLRADLDIVLTATVLETGAINYDIVLAAAMQKTGSINDATGNVLSENELILLQMEREGILSGHSGSEVLLDPQLMLQALERGYNSVPGPLLHDKDVVLAALEKGVLAYDDLPRSMRRDSDVIQHEISKWGEAGIYPPIPEEALDDRDVLEEVLRYFPGKFFELPPEAQADDHNALTLVGHINPTDRRLFEIRSGDRDFLLDALKKCPAVWQNFPPALRRDRRLLIDALGRHRETVWEIPDHLLNDADFLIEASESYPEVLDFIRVIEHASICLCSDAAFMLRAVEKNETVLKYASAALRRDRDFMLEALERSAGAYRYASEELRSDRTFTEMALRKDGRNLEYAAEELRGDPELVQIAVEQHGGAFQYASEQLRGDRELALLAVERYGIAFQYASEQLRGDRELALKAVERYGSAFQYASDQLRCDRELALIVLATIQGGPFFPALFLNTLPEHLCDDSEIVLAALRRAPGALRFASERLRNDRDIVAAAVSLDGTALRYASKRLQEDEGMQQLAKSQQELESIRRQSQEEPPEQVITRLKVGSIVTHAAYGRGKLLSIHEAGTMTRGEVLFDSVGKKTLILKFAGLKVE